MVSREHRFQNRLPPKVLSRKKKGKKGNKSSKRRKKPWYRHAPWIVSLAACGVFIVLLGGFFGVRQVVILVRGSNSEVTAEDNGSPADSADQKESADPELAASLKSSEPGMEVLPPKAAMQPGRKLPKMLLVGRGVNMFPDLAEAMKVAIGGDIIEICDNGPMYLEPGNAVWKGKEGTLTIRGGKGFQPVLTRTIKKGHRHAGRDSMITIFSHQPDKSGELKCIIHNLVFVNLVPYANRGQRPYNRAIVSDIPVNVRRCVFVTDSKTVQIKQHDQCVVENCYFRGFGRSRLFDMMVGQVVIRNNLFVWVGRGNTPFQCTSRCSAMFEHNTFMQCGTYLAPHDASIVESRNNVFIRPSGSFIAFHIGGINTMEKAQRLIDYRGTKNLYLFDDLEFEYWLPGQGLLSGLANWQRLTNNGERNPIFADPKFANPQLVQAAKNQILPPKAFALRSDSPAKGAGTDGKDIGCDLSRIPTPPPIVEKLIAQILQKK